MWLIYFKSMHTNSYGSCILESKNVLKYKVALTNSAYGLCTVHIQMASMPKSSNQIL